MECELRAYLGGHEGLSSHELHNEEVAAPVMRAGRKAGSRVEMEDPAYWASQGGRPLAPRSQRSTVEQLLRPVGAVVVDDVELMRVDGVERCMRNAVEFNRTGMSSQHESW